MKAFALLAACGLATLAGCQVSGEAEVGSTRSSSTRGEMGMASGGGGAGATGGYSMAYQAAEDTEWAASADASATRGTIRRGETVMFNRAPDSSQQWQQARLADGTVRYVRPNAFRMSSSR